MYRELPEAIREEVRMRPFWGIGFLRKSAGEAVEEKHAGTENR